MQAQSRSNIEIARKKAIVQKKRRILLGLAVTFAALVLFVYIYFFTSPRSQTVYFNSLEERQALANPKLYQLQELAAPNSPAPASNTSTSSEIVLNEAETNAVLQTYVDSDPGVRQALEKLGVREPSVKLNYNSVDMAAKVKYSGVTVPVTMNLGMLQSAPNTVRVVVISANVGRMPVTGELRNKLTHAVNSAAPGGQFTLPKGIAALRVESGKLVITKDTPVANPYSTPTTPPYTY